MSMPVAFYAVTPRQLAQYRAAVLAARAQPTTIAAGKADDDWSDVLPAGPDPEAVLARARKKKGAYVYLDWESFGLSWLLGAPAGTRFRPIFGADAGNACVVLDSEAVATAAELLASVPLDELRGRFRPAEMQRAGVHPEDAWTEPHAWDALAGAFESVRELFQRAAQNGSVIVVDGRV